MVNLNKIKKLQAQIDAELIKLIDEDGKISLNSFGIEHAKFKTVADAELYAKYYFPNENHYSIDENTVYLNPVDE